MRVVSRLLAAVMMVGLLLPIGASPAKAAVDINNFSVEPDDGVVGEDVHLADCILQH